MAYRRIAILIASALWIGTVATTEASAADMGGFFGDPQDVPEAKVEFGSGWYVRGDIGVSRGLDVQSSDLPYDRSLFTQQGYPGTPAVAAANSTTTTTTNADGTMTATTTPATSAVAAVPGTPNMQYPRGAIQGPGQTTPSIITGGSSRILYDGSLGAGYQFNKWFRADAIFDFHQPISNSYLGAGRECITGTYGVGPQPYTYEQYATTTCTPTLKSSLKSYDALINGYIDLGTWHSVTPYIGAGVGLSFGHAQASATFTQGNLAPYNVNYSDAITGGTYNQYWDRSSSVQYYNLAFAFMGGVAIDVFDHTKLDIGYRYLNLGSVIGTNLYVQEVRAGLRYMIDN